MTTMLWPEEMNCINWPSESHQKRNRNTHHTIRSSSKSFMTPAWIDCNYQHLLWHRQSRITVKTTCIIPRVIWHESNSPFGEINVFDYPLFCQIKTSSLRVSPRDCYLFRTLTTETAATCFHHLHYYCSLYSLNCLFIPWIRRETRHAGWVTIPPTVTTTSATIILMQTWFPAAVEEEDCNRSIHHPLLELPQVARNLQFPYQQMMKKSRKINLRLHQRLVLLPWLLHHSLHRRVIHRRWLIQLRHPLSTINCSISNKRQQPSTLL